MSECVQGTSVLFAFVYLSMGFLISSSVLWLVYLAYKKMRNSRRGRRG